MGRFWRQPWASALTVAVVSSGLLVAGGRWSRNCAAVAASPDTAVCPVPACVSGTFFTHPGDLDCDGRIGETDIALAITALFCDPCEECDTKDANGDGVVSVADLLAVLQLGVAVPQNVVAKGGYHRTVVTWDPVSGATGYKLYAAAAPNVVLATITPVDVAAPPYQHGGLPNWVPVYYRVAAVFGATVGPPSAEVQAIPTAGHVVTQRDSPPNAVVRIFHADEPGVPVDTIDDGVLITRMNEQSFLYGILPTLSAFSYPEVGLVVSGQRLVLGGEAGHGYIPLNDSNGFDIPSPDPRIAVVDYTTGNPATSAATIRSWRLDGTGEATLAACASRNVNSNSALDAAGIVFECDGSYQFSDGVQPGTILPGTSTLRTPVGMTSDRVVTLSSTNNHLFTQSLSGANDEVALAGGNGYPAGSSNEELLAIGPGNRLLVGVDNAGGKELYTIDEDATDADLKIRSRSTGNHVFKGAIGTGDRALVFSTDVGGTNDFALVIPFANLGSVVNLVPTTYTTATATELLASGNIAVALSSLILIRNGWAVETPAGAFVGRVLAPNTDRLVGSLAGRVIFASPTTGAPGQTGPANNLYSKLENNTGLTILNIATGAQKGVSEVKVRSGGYVQWLDGPNGGPNGLPEPNQFPSIALPDGSFKVNLDTDPAVFAGDAGLGEGGRLFTTIRRPDANFYVSVFDLGTMTSTRIAGDDGVTERGFYLAPPPVTP